MKSGRLTLYLCRIAHGRQFRDMRKTTLPRVGVTTYTPGAVAPEPIKITIKPLSSYSDSDLAADGSDRSSRLKRLLTELGTRKSDEALNPLAVAVSLYDEDLKKPAREGWLANLAQQSASIVQARWKDDRIEMKIATATTAGVRGLRACGGELIDEAARVRDAAHQALVKLNRGGDLGPSATANEADRNTAVKKWRKGFAKQSRF
jgi:hypothetical protein